ncbi:MAG: carboxypeptidase regulatory-like domain-containing protein [Thermoanaerobaculia bacterium]|nr:carboxypeptidase regulatory-like domain-containing protein [Thermoanaerobaculia bacterium]
MTSRRLRNSLLGFVGLVALLLGMPAASRGAPLEATITVPGRSQTEPKLECVLRATSGESTKEWLLQVPWRGELDLPLDRSWKLHAEAGGFWAQNVSIEPGTASAPLELLLLPAGAVKGKLQPPEGGALPQALRVKISAPPPRRGEKRSPIPTTELLCPLAEGAFECPLPAGALDLKLQAGSWAPHYFWAAEVPAGQTADLGTLRLRSGASLVGWVEVAGQHAAAEPPVVELKLPMMGQSFDPREEARQGLRTVTQKVDERGFFQLVGLAPGGYLLTATTPGFALPEPLLVDVLAERETVLEDPIALQPMHPLEVWVEPPLGPEGAPWQVQVGKERATIPVVDTLAKSPASSEGFWRSPVLAPGTYRLSISDTNRSIWYEQEVQLDAIGSPLSIEIPLIAIAGRVSRGEEPVVAIVSFGTTQGRPEIRIATNEEGEFKGYLPRDGEWPVELVFGEQDRVVQAVEPVSIEKPSGGEPAWVEIELPKTELVVRVIDGEVPVAGANVLVLRNREQGGRRREAMLRSDENGELTLRGLSAGEILLQAEVAERSSPWTLVELQEGRSGATVVLRLAEQIEISGRVFSPAGPVAGANVVGMPGGTANDMAFWAQTVTAGDGSFTLEAPGDARWLDVVVVPPGLPVRLARIALTQKKQLALDLQVSAQGGNLLIGEAIGSADPKAPGPFLLSYGDATINAFSLLRLLAFGRIESGEEGHELLGLEPGLYTLCRSSGADCSSGFLPVGGRLELVTASKQEHVD